MENNEHTQKKAGKKPGLLASLVALVGAALLIAAFFLPYASATEDCRELFESYPDTMYYEDAGITAQDAADLSLLEFDRIYIALAEEGYSEKASTSYVVVISLIGVFSLLALLFALLKRPILLILSDALAFGAFRLIVYDFEDRGVLPSSIYDWGIACELYSVAAAVVLVGAVILLIAKIMAKKKQKVAETTDGQ